MTALLLLFASTLTLAPPAEHVEEEYRQPQFAVAGQRVAVTFGTRTAIYYAESSDNGGQFSKPVMVAGNLDALALGRHRGPRVALLPDAIVISAIVGPQPKGDLIAWRSTDHGRTWTRTAVINDVPGAAREGLHAMAADGQGRLFAAWLDLRDKGTHLYGARSTDGGRTWSKNVMMYASPDGTICQCCHPSLAIDSNGSIYAMWRNALGGSRDLYLARSTDHGLTFSPAQKLGQGTWQLDACPMDGGALAFEKGQPVTAWRRANELFLARPGQPEQRLGAGKDVAMAINANGAYTIWSSPQGIQLLAPGASAPVTLAPQGAFPQLATLPDGEILAAWEEKGALHFERHK